MGQSAEALQRRLRDIRDQFDENRRQSAALAEIIRHAREERRPRVRGRQAAARGKAEQPDDVGDLDP